MNIRWNIILALIALFVFGWFYHLQDSNEGLQDFVKNDEKPEYTGKKMRTDIFSPTGVKQYIAEAEKVEYYSKDGHTEFYAPILYLFDLDTSKFDTKFSKTDPSIESQPTQNKGETTKESWKLVANKAILTKNNMLYLEGNIVMQSLSPISRVQRIETEKAIVNLTTQDISSDTMVSIFGQNFKTTGLKMDGNLQKQIATLKEQVRTYYEIINNQ